MKIWIVTTNNPVGYVGTRASKKEAIDLVHEKYPNAISVGELSYMDGSTYIAVYEDELPMSDEWDDTK